MTKNIPVNQISKLVVALFTVLAVQPTIHASVMSFPGLSGIRFSEISGFTLQHYFLPNSPAMTSQLATLDAASNDFLGVPNEFYDVFYSDANGSFNLSGSYVTVEAKFDGQGGGGLNLAAVDLLLGPAPYVVCRADILASFVGMGSNYIPGSELLAVDPDSPIPTTATVMGNTAGVPGRLRVTVGWTKLQVPEPSTCLMMLCCGVVLCLGRRRVNDA